MKNRCRRALLARELPCTMPDMRAVSATAAMVGSICLFGAGCAHEFPAWPPPAADIQRINEAAEDDHWLRVEYIEPIASMQGRHVDRPIRIESLNDDEIRFRTATGETRPVPLDLVSGVTVKDRKRGAFVGTGAGVALALTEVAAWYWLAHTGCEGSNAGFQGEICSGRIAIVLVVPTVLAGMGLGYLIGGRRTFHLGPVR
jgi:hypothetical protein